MPKFEVEFTHEVEHKYKGWVEAESEHEARMMVEDDPFSISDLEETEEQGIEVRDIELEEVEDEE